MMEKCKHKWKIPLGISLILLGCIPIHNQAQSVKRQCISSYGAIAMSDDVTFKQTAGQPYNTKASYESQVSILQGFQHPDVFMVETIKSSLFENLNLHVYPNPAMYSVAIESEKVIEDALIYVSDINGMLIFSKQVAEFKKYDISCIAWQNGIYIITVQDKNQIKSTLILTINK